MAKKRSSPWVKNICHECGIEVPMRNKKPNAICERCCIDGMTKARKLTPEDDEGIVYQG